MELSGTNLATAGEIETKVDEGHGAFMMMFFEPTYQYTIDLFVSRKTLLYYNSKQTYRLAYFASNLIKTMTFKN